jgi:hypothetical protein
MATLNALATTDELTPRSEKLAEVKQKRIALETVFSWWQHSAASFFGQL